jgi:hypothetical protein
MSRGVGVDKLLSLIGHTNHKETHLLILTCLIATFLVSDRVGLGANDVRT